MRSSRAANDLFEQDTNFCVELPKSLIEQLIEELIHRLQDNLKWRKLSGVNHQKTWAGSIKRNDLRTVPKQTSCHDS